MNIEIIRHFRHDLRRLERIMAACLREDTCCHGVSVAQCHCLLAVEQLGSSSLGGLANYLELDKSTLSRTVDGLVRAGKLNRKPAVDDRRTTMISLSPSGQQVCDAINRVNDDRFGAILQAVDHDPDQLVNLFSRLVDAMASHNRAGRQATAPFPPSQPKSSGAPS